MQAREETIAEIELEEEVAVEVCIPEAYPADEGGEEFADGEGEFGEEEEFDEEEISAEDEAMLEELENIDFESMGFRRLKK